MNIDKFKQFEKCSENGLRKEAGEAVRDFIDSFGEYEEKEKWVKVYLNSLDVDANSKLRHELFEEIIFPVLKAGYESKDAWSYLMLVKFIQNIYQSKNLSALMDEKSDFQLIKECFEYHPENKEVKKFLLEIQIRWFQYCEHEWPSGILYGINGATPSQLEEILEEVRIAREIDEESKYVEFLNSFEGKVNEYKKKA